MCVQIDPLGSPPSGAAEMTPEFHGITEADLRQIPAQALGGTAGTGAGGMTSMLASQRTPAKPWSRMRRARNFSATLQTTGRQSP